MKHLKLQKSTNCDQGFDGWSNEAKRIWRKIVKKEINEKSNSEMLKLLDDRVYNSQSEANSDDFNHKSYAKLLSKIFNPSSENSFGISVALFGKWGQGKSFVVEMLKDELPADKVQVIVFNAWQSRGDSVRRQLVLSILESVNSKKAKQYKKHSGINVPQEFDDKDWKEILSTYFKTFCKILISPSVGVAFLSSIILLLIVLISFGFAFAEQEHKEVFIAIASLFASGSVFLFSKMFDSIKSIQEKNTGPSIIAEHQMLKYPEQFAEIASRYMAAFCKATKKEILIVVDDLDRCDPKTVVEALACIKHLSAIQQYESGKRPIKLRFLVPCDEKQVILALESDGDQHKYGDAIYHDYKSQELLRKFFDIVVRMDEFLPDDMVAYARSLLGGLAYVTSRDVNLIQELIGAVAPSDPRQVKSLINAYLVFKGKISIMQESERFRDSDSLNCFDKTCLLVIALQETVPDVYEKMVDISRKYDQPQGAPSEFERRRSDMGLAYLLGQPVKVGLPVNENEDVEISAKETKAIQIIRALEPVDESTFYMLTRKGIPESLACVPCGPQIYDAVISGDVKSFNSEIIKLDRIDDTLVWLKEYRKLIYSVAQFRNALQCLIETEILSDQRLKDVVSDYISHFPRLREALLGFSGLYILAEKSNILDQCASHIYDAILSNLCDSNAGGLLDSEEFKSVVVFVEKLDENDRARFEQKIVPLLKGSEASAAINTLSSLKKALPENCSCSVPAFALSVASNCTWVIYNTTTPEENKGLHSDVILSFIGDDEGDLKKLIDVLFEDVGPLATQIGLNASSRKGEREGLMTLQKISQRLPDEVLQNIFQKLKPWFAPQSVPENFKYICNIFSAEWPRLSEKQIEELAVLVTDHCIATNTTEWICDFIKGVDLTSEEINTSYRKFCSKVFLHLNQKYLTGPTINQSIQNMLICIGKNHWPLAEEADRALAEAIKTKVNNQQSWINWKDALWQIAKSKPENTNLAICERITKNFLPDALIPFAVNEICGKRLSPLLRSSLKGYFFADQNSVNTAWFKTIFEDEQIKETEKLLEIIIDEFESRTAGLNDQQVNFVSIYINRVDSDREKLFERFIRVRYLQGTDVARLFMGIRCLSKVRNISRDVFIQVKELLTEQNVRMTEEQRSLAKEVFGDEIIVSPTSEESNENS